MAKEELKKNLVAFFPAATLEEGGDWITMFIDSSSWKNIAQILYSAEDLYFDYLFCLTCIDWKTHFTIVYHLTSTVHRHTLVVKANTERSKPEIESVSNIWRTAEFHEREVYDLFGIMFLNHPDLRRLFLTDEWKGWPLRKDYEDPVNMIKL